MLIFLDSAKIEEIKEVSSWGIIDGLTTNPTLIEKSGRKFDTGFVKELTEYIHGPISVEVIKDDDVDITSINDDTVLVGENGIFYDSVDVLELIVELENRFGIKIKDNDLIREKLKTFQTLFQFIKENKK